MWKKKRWHREDAMLIVQNVLAVARLLLPTPFFSRPKGLHAMLAVPCFLFPSPHSAENVFVPNGQKRHIFHKLNVDKNIFICYNHFAGKRLHKSI